MNKKGYLRIMEAILAIILVFSFILFILPKKDVNLIKVDPELESTVESIAKQIERQPDMRNCVISNSDSTVCINEYIKNKIKAQGFDITSQNIISDVIQKYPEDIDDKLNSIGSDVYTKNFIIAYPDITESGTNIGLQLLPNKKLIRLLFWSKQ